LIATMALTILIGSPVAMAQTKGVAQAPIGHRQPRADQMTSEKTPANPNDVLEKENALIGRKMKSICRGC